MTEIRVEVYDRTNGEEHVGAYRSLAAPRIGELVMVQVGEDPKVRMLRIEDVYWMAMPVHDVRALPHGAFEPRALDTVTIFGREADGPHEA